MSKLLSINQPYELELDFLLRKSKLPYPVSLDLFLSAILSEKHADLHLEEITQKELVKLKQDFETCLKNMKEAAEIESEKS